MKNGLLRWKKRSAKWLRSNLVLRHRLGLGVSYVYVEHTPETEEYDAETGVIPLVDDDFLHYQISEAGVDDDDLEFWKDKPSGYYLVKYESHNEQDYSEGWPCGPEYCVFDGFTEATPAPIMGRICDFHKNKWLPFWDCAWGVVTPSWKVDIEYGGVGISTSRTWLPKALFIRFVYTKPWTRGWGDNWTRLELRRGGW